MGFRQRWIEFLSSTAQGSRKARSFMAPLGAAAFFAFSALFVVVPLALERWLGLPKLPGSPLNVVIAMPLLAVGVFLVVWCNVHFVRARGTPVPLDPPKRLVDSGPYAYCRNPMLTGLFAILIGLGVLLGSLLLVFVFAPLYVALHVIELKQIEEPELERRLGPAYLEYKARVPMFVPRFRRARAG